MNPVELIRVFVLCEIMDDYEEVEHITENITKLGAQCGVVIQKQDVVDALVSLTEHGFAKAYRLGRTTKEIEGVPSLDDILDPDLYTRCYFWATPKGNNEHTRLRSLDAWPFDEEGELKG